MNAIAIALPMMYGRPAGRPRRPNCPAFTPYCPTYPIGRPASRPYHPNHPAYPVRTTGRSPSPMTDDHHTQPESTGDDPQVEPQIDLSVGDRVRVALLPPYVKTAEPMPMLRPPHVVKLGEEGTIVDYRPGNHWSVRFQGGTFLIDGQYLERA